MSRSSLRMVDRDISEHGRCFVTVVPYSFHSFTFTFALRLIFFDLNTEPMILVDAP